MGKKMEQPKSSRIPAALENFDSLPDSAFVRLPTVSALRNCSNATTWRHAKQGLIPSPRKLSAGISAWNVGELRACLAAAGMVAS
jgi:predicted DNA-binding transcriptional regulator AlpA